MLFVKSKALSPSHPWGPVPAQVRIITGPEDPWKRTEDANGETSTQDLTVLGVLWNQAL